jgi:hypothetical protein
MNKKLLLPLALVGVVAMGATAASGIGSATVDRESLPGDRERVTLDVERDQAGSAGAASAIVSAKAKKPKIQHFVASEAVPVPVLPDASEIVQLSCPGKAKVISGDYVTSNGIFADQFGAVAKKRFEFGFVSILEDPGEAIPGIFCAKGVK